MHLLDTKLKCFVWGSQDLSFSRAFLPRNSKLQNLMFLVASTEEQLVKTCRQLEGKISDRPYGSSLGADDGRFSVAGSAGARTYAVNLLASSPMRKLYSSVHTGWVSTSTVNSFANENIRRRRLGGLRGSKEKKKSVRWCRRVRMRSTI